MKKKKKTPRVEEQILAADAVETEVDQIAEIDTPAVDSEAVAQDEPVEVAQDEAVEQEAKEESPVVEETAVEVEDEAVAQEDAPVDEEEIHAEEAPSELIDDVPDESALGAPVEPIDENAEQELVLEEVGEEELTEPETISDENEPILDLVTEDEPQEPAETPQEETLEEIIEDETPEVVVTDENEAIVDVVPEDIADEIPAIVKEEQADAQEPAEALQEETPEVIVTDENEEVLAIIADEEIETPQDEVLAAPLSDAKNEALQEQQADDALPAIEGEEEQGDEKPIELEAPADDVVLEDILTDAAADEAPQEDELVLDLDAETPQEPAEEHAQEGEAAVGDELVLDVEGQNGDEQTGEEALEVEKESDEPAENDDACLVVGAAAPKRKRPPKPRNFKAVNTDKPFRLWSVITGWLLFLANAFLVYALVGSAMGGKYFANAGVLPLSPFSYSHILTLVGLVQSKMDVFFIVDNVVPIIAFITYAIAVLIAWITLICSLVRVFGICGKSDISIRRARYSKLYRGVVHGYSAALLPLAICTLWGSRLTSLGTATVVIAALLYLMYSWLYSWFYNADNEANRPDVFEFWSGGVRRTLALLALGVTVYCFADNWLETVFNTWRSALVYVSDGGFWTLVGYYLNLLSPLWMAFILLALVGRLRRLVRSYGGDFVPETGGKKVDKVEYREEKTVYKINSGLARVLMYMAVAAIADGVQAYGFLGLSKTALLSYLALRWIGPVCGVLATVVLLASGRKEKPHIKKHKKKKRGSSSSSHGNVKLEDDDSAETTSKSGKHALVIDEDEEE